MKDKEFKSWRRINLAIGMIGVITAIAGTIANLAGHPYGRFAVIVGVFWYAVFYLRYVVVRRWHEGDRFRALLEEYTALRGETGVLRSRLGEQRNKLGDQAMKRSYVETRLGNLELELRRMLKRHLARDIGIATLLTRRFVILALHRYATQYRHALVNPILDLIQKGVIHENEVIKHLDEPAAFADVVFSREEELRTTCPELIALCRGHWPPPESEPGTPAPALPPDGRAAISS